MINDEANYLRSIREQYESYPYPPRDPVMEKQRLILTETEFLGKISHYCFNGRLDLTKGFRALVAGGGTGDQTIFLAEQLRGYDAEVVYLDLSSASMKIAKRRAEIRGLDNITWVHGSILDVDNLQLGKFDYINCCGVLMVLEDPVMGLIKLKTCLKEQAAIGIMVYAKYGRTGIYHMQELMRLINITETDMSRKLENTKMAYSSLPTTHCLKCGPVPLSEAHAAELHDSDWYDLFLISQDIAYTVSELYNWLEASELNLISFAAQRELYEPETVIANKQLLKKVQALPLSVQQSIAENFVSTISRHRFYTTASQNTMASISDQDNIPYFCDLLPFTPEMTQQFQDLISQQPVGVSVPLHFQHENINILLPIHKLTRLLVKYIDGRRTIGEIVKSAKNDPDLKSHRVTRAEISHQFTHLFDHLNKHNLLLLRHKNTTPFNNYLQLQAAGA